MAAVPSMPSLPRFFTGVNVYDLAHSEIFECNSPVDDPAVYLDKTLGALRTNRVEVVRFWASEAYAWGSGGARDWSALDRVFAKALQYGIYLIPTLAQQTDACDPEVGVDSVSWAREFAGRYGTHPTLLAVDVVNEPLSPGYCPDPEDDGCLLNEYQPLYAGLRDRIDAVKTGTAQPVFYGNTNTGQPGFERPLNTQAMVYAGSQIASLHEYAWGVAGVPGPCTGIYAGSPCFAIQDAKAMPVRLIVEELGNNSGVNNCDNASNASRLRSKLTAYRDAGVWGVVFWQFNVYRTSGCSEEIGPNGRMIKVFRDF